MRGATDVHINKDVRSQYDSIERDSRYRNSNSHGSVTVRTPR